MDIQSVWAAIFGALVFLATIGTIIVAIPTANAGVHKFFGAVKTWWRRGKRLETQVALLDGKLRKLEEMTEGRIKYVSDRFGERTAEVINDYKYLHGKVDEFVNTLDRVTTLEEFEKMARPVLADLQETVLRIEAAQVRSETEQQQALDDLRTNVARLRERVENMSRGFLPRP